MTSLQCQCSVQRRNSVLKVRSSEGSNEVSVLLRPNPPWSMRQSDSHVFRVCGDVRVFDSQSCRREIGEAVRRSQEEAMMAAVSLL